jgi:hypothetical protein
VAQASRSSRGKIVDQSGLFGDGNEPFHRDHAMCSVNPEGRRFKANHRATLEIEAGLVDGADVAAVQGGAQVSLELVALPDLAIHLGFEESQRGAPFRLGAIQRDIRLAQSLFRHCCIVWHDGDADSGANLVLQRAGGNRHFQRLDHAQCHIGGGFRADQMARQNRKFIPAESGEQITAAHGGQQPLCDDDQHLVADGMAVNIVDLLEPVQVQQKYRVHGTAARRSRQRGLQCIVELAAIRQPGETILEGKFARLRFRGQTARRFTFLFEVAPNREHQHGEHEHAAQEQEFVDFDCLFLDGNFALVREDVDLPGVEHGNQHDDQDQR